jgi:hypothetical protein
VCPNLAKIGDFTSRRWNFHRGSRGNPHEFGGPPLFLKIPRHFARGSLNRNINDIELLQKEGILIRTEGFFFAKKSPHYKNILSVHHDHPIEFWALAQLYAFKKHNQTGSTFIIGQFNNNVIFSEFDPDEAFFFVESPPWDKNLTSNVLGLRQESFFSTKNELERGPIIDLQLYRAIPVPIEKVPIENILKFKDIRKDELLRFRHAMDAFYLSIINSNDIPRAKTHAIDEIDLSLCDINRVMKESGWKRILSNIDVSIKIPQPSELINNITIAGAGGAYIGSKIGIPHTCAVIGMAAGAITSFIKVDVKEAFKPRRIPDNLMDFAYLYYAKEELGK